jgi:hypothetical protein
MAYRADRRLAPRACPSGAIDTVRADARAIDVLREHGADVVCDPAECLDAA